MSEQRYRGRYKIPSIRLRNWDYKSPGYYFITICTEIRVKWFGSIHNNRVCLSDAGSMAWQYWLEIPRHFPNVQLDEFIVMPDHIHGIIQITNDSIKKHSVSNLHSVETRYIASLHKNNKFGPLPKQSLSSIVHSYKSAVTRKTRNNINSEFKWQPRYYERIIRTNQELNNVRQYILNNPKNWRKVKT